MLSAYTARIMEREDETKLETLARSLSSTVVDSTNSSLVCEFEASEHYLAMDVTEALGLDANEGTRKFALRTKPCLSQHYAHRRPVHQRTRIITASHVRFEGVDYVVLKCSCTHWHFHMCMCRHVMALLDRQPGIGDVFPENTKVYELFYGQGNDAWDKKVDLRTLFLESSGGVVIVGNLKDVSVKGW